MVSILRAGALLGCTSATLRSVAPDHDEALDTRSVRLTWKVTPATASLDSCIVEVGDAPSLADARKTLARAYTSMRQSCVASFAILSWRRSSARGVQASRVASSRVMANLDWSYKARFSANGRSAPSRFPAATINA